MVTITEQARSMEHTSSNKYKSEKTQIVFITVYGSIKTFCTAHCREYLASPQEKAF